MSYSFIVVGDKLHIFNMAEPPTVEGEIGLLVGVIDTGEDSIQNEILVKNWLTKQGLIND